MFNIKLIENGLRSVFELKGRPIIKFQNKAYIIFSILL